MIKIKIGMILLIFLSCIIVESGVKGNNSTKFVNATYQESVGEGSSLPFPLLSRLFFGFELLRPQDHFSYLASSSFAGVNAAISPNSTTDFWLSEIYPTQEELEYGETVGEKTLYISPITAAAIVAVVNVDSLPVPANSNVILTQEALVKIFNGDLTMWNDPLIVSTNSFLADYAEQIVVIVREESSGTTLGLLEGFHAMEPLLWPYLPSSTFPPEVIAKIGSRLLYATTGNLGELASVKTIPNSIGYVVLSFTVLTDYPASGLVLLTDPYSSSSNTPVDPFDGLQVAVNNYQLNADGSYNILNIPVPGAWPIAKFSLLLFNVNFTDYSKEECLIPGQTARFFNWVVTNPQARQDGVNVGYAPIPLSLARNFSKYLYHLRCHGEPLIPVDYLDQRSSGVWDAMLAIAMTSLVFPLAITLGFLLTDWSRATKIGISFIGSTVLGAILLLISVIFFYLLPDKDSICQLRVWLVGLGYVLLITPVSSKVFWLTVASARSRTLKKTRITLFRSSLPILISLGLQITLLVVWAAVDPYQSTTVINNQLDNTAEYFCESQTIWLWIGLEIAYFSILILLGFVLSFYATETPFASVREVAWIGFTLYNLMVFMIILIPLIGAFDNPEDAVYFEITIGLIFSSVFTLLTLYSQYLASGLLPSAPFMNLVSSNSIGEPSTPSQSGTTPTNHQTVG